MKLLLLGLVFMLVAISAPCPAVFMPKRYACPIHDGRVGVFQRSENLHGVVVAVYRCPLDHEFVVRMCK